MTLGEEILPNKISVRIDERFFAVSKTVALLLQKLIDLQVPTDPDLTAAVLQSRLSVGQAKIVADNLVSYLIPDKKSQSFLKQVRRGFVKLPLYIPNEKFVDIFRGLVVTRLNGIILAITCLFITVICITKAPGLPIMTSLKNFSIGELIGLWIALTLTTIVHEFGHAVMAANYGIRPRSMGIALFLLQPAGFADVSNGWLSSPENRIMIALGGFIFQTIPLFIASLLWFVTNNSIYGFYCLSNIGIMILNTIPLVRTDGYWILVNIIKDPHLSSRTASFATMSLKNPAKFLHFNQTEQAYAVFGLSSLIYTIGMYIIGLGTILTRFPNNIQQWAPIIITGALLLYFGTRFIWNLFFVKQPRHETFAND